jgi:hypothetical protein
MSKDTSQTTSRNSHLHVTNEFALLEVIPDAKRLRDSKNLTSIYMMEGKPEEWSNDGGQYLVNHTLQVELKADQGVYYISQESSMFKKTYFINLNQTFPEEKIVKETMSLEATDNYKFTYDSKHDEIIFAIYNPASKNLDVEFYDGTTLQDSMSPR